MSEIKFRGKGKSDLKWVYGCLTDIIKTSEGTYYYIRPLEYSSERIERGVIPETVGQFTGLNDRKGNPIYEGDILEDFDGEKWEMITVKYGNGKFEAMFLDESTEDLCGVCNRMTIVGNIYDNPELWEGGKI